MAENDENDENDDYWYRVVTSLTRDEWIKLQALAKNDGRSMSSYLRQLLRKDIKDFFD